MHEGCSAHCACAGQSGEEEGGWTYEYVPGAGDDEETWARGLTPSLLFRHQEVRSAWPDSILVHLG